MRHTIIYISFFFFCFASFGQNKKNIIDTSQFELDTSITQNKCKFHFWKGSTDTTQNKLCIERVYKNKDTIIFNDYISDGEFELFDINDDGFADFITFYHENDIIHFFNPQTNKFNDKVVGMPSERTKIDKKENIYCGFHETMYGDKYSFSVLYKYKDTLPVFFYKLIFITTKEGFESMDKVRQIKLYKFQNNDYLKPVFIENVKTDKPNKFDYELYWRKNYKRLLGSS